jgi:ABC-type uncharacterized transport system substrate-binding protein
MRRREFIARLGAAGAYAAVPRFAHAQQSTRTRRVAILAAGDEDQATTAIVAMFRNEWARLGWAEGRNLQIDVRFGHGDVDRIRANAAELVGLAPDVIVASGIAVRVLQQQTQTIPIVLAFAGDVWQSRGWSAWHTSSTLSSGSIFGRTRPTRRRGQWKPALAVRTPTTRSLAAADLDKFSELFRTTPPDQ